MFCHLHHLPINKVFSVEHFILKRSSFPFKIFTFDTLLGGVSRSGVSPNSC